MKRESEAWVGTTRLALMFVALASLTCDNAGDGGEPVEIVSRALTADSRNVWTNHNDNNRTGATLAETILTTSNVNASSFGKIYERAVDDQVYAQPLWLANVTIGGSTRNVLYVATVNGTVYAFDADNAAASSPIASRNLRPAGSTTIRNTDFTCYGGAYQDFSGNMSIVGTPVINVAAGTMYLILRYKDSGGAFKQELHALDVTSTTLAERTGSPVLITASVAGTGDGSSGGTLAFNSFSEGQRSGLVLTGGKVYIAWASQCDTFPYHGWVIGYDAATLARTFVWNSSPNGGLGGIWQAGQPPAVDGTGKLYFMTGNGTSTARTGGNAYGHSFVKLDPALGSPVASWFTPFDVDSANAADADLGSAGPLIPPDVTTRIIGGGKPGKLYVLNSASLGGYQSGSDSQIVQSFPAAAGHIHGSPVYYNAPGINKKLVYLWSEYDYLKSFEWNAGGSGTMTSTPYRTSTMRVPDGMPGAMLSISANDGIDNTGVLWATHPFSGDANHTSQPGILRAFNAKDVSVELWNSKANAADDFGLFGKYAPPTIANGKVFIATHSNKIAVYGLKSQGSGTGLRGEYFDNIDFTASRVIRTDATVNFDWGAGSPDASVGADTFSARWTGKVEAPETGTYTFCTDTDDGGRLWVNNVQVVSSWVDQGLGVQECGTISLTANTKYDIKMEMYENAGGAGAKLFWAIPSNPTHVIIPQTRLYPGLTIFTTQTPAVPNITDNQAYELGTKFRSSQAGQITGIRYYRAPSETGTHTGRIWSSGGTVLASVTFSGETASGWQQATLSTPLSITANTTYVVTVNTNTYYVATNSGLATSVVNGPLSTVADGANGVFGALGAFPTQSFQNTNYFRDIVFVASSAGLSVFTTQTPAVPNITDNQAYELGMKFRSSQAGQITAIRYYRASSETGTHTGRIWSSTGTVLASVSFSGETSSGWQQATLSTALSIAANTTYVVTVNTNTYYVATNSGLATSIVNGPLSTVADGANGVFGALGAFPTQTFQNTNYFRDIVFVGN